MNPNILTKLEAWKAEFSNTILITKGSVFETESEANTTIISTLGQSILMYCKSKNGELRLGTFFFDKDYHELGRFLFYLLQQNVLRIRNVHALNAYLEMSIAWANTVIETIPAVDAVMDGEVGITPAVPESYVYNKTGYDYKENKAKTNVLLSVTDDNLDAILELLTYDGANYPANIYLPTMDFEGGTDYATKMAEYESSELI